MGKGYGHAISICIKCTTKFNDKMTSCVYEL